MIDVTTVSQEIKHRFPTFNPNKSVACLIFEVTQNHNIICYSSKSCCERVASLSQSWILLAKKNMILASHWSIFFIIILAILNDIEGGQLRDELCCEGA